MTKPKVGMIVDYKLTAEDAGKINRRRTNNESIVERIAHDKWVLGAQAHIGNEASEGQVMPMIITAVWGDTCVNGQVFLDGNDTFWATSVNAGNKAGHWNWPVK